MNESTIIFAYHRLQAHTFLGQMTKSLVVTSYGSYILSFCKKLIGLYTKLGTVTHAFNLSTQEAEAKGWDI